MALHDTTAHLIGHKVEVTTSGKQFSVTRFNDTREAGICPIDYLAGALGS